MIENEAHKRTAIVTGAGSGIGRATSRLLIDAGWNVVLVGRNQASLDATRNASAAPDQAVVEVADVSEADAIDAIFDRACSAHGKVHLLFNNAGVSLPAKPLPDIKPAELEQLLRINVLGAMNCARAAIRTMTRDGGGRIINNGSVSAQVPRPLSAAYSTSKHAITGLTKSILLDGRTTQVYCSQIDIGNAATDMAAYMTAGALQANGEMQPEPQFPAEEVAKLVLHIASLPEGVNIPFVTIMAAEMPLFGRG